MGHDEAVTLRSPALTTSVICGSVVISATLQAILNVIDFGKSPVAELRARWATRSCTRPHSFERMMSRAHLISTLGGKMRGGAGVGYAWLCAMDE